MPDEKTDINPPVLKITLEDAKHIRVKVLIPQRIAQHGFGTFIEGIKVGEISITKEAKKAILKQPYRNGLQGMEIFSSNIIGYGSRLKEIVIPLEQISVHKENAKVWFKKCAID